jgi:hypothetical protein
MNLRIPVAIFVLTGAGPAGAHRVDEYLQATRIAIETARVDLEIDLTAGSALASQVMAWIDTNRDGEISQPEGEAYARQVLGSVVLKVDGQPVTVQLLETSIPQFSDMLLGVGTLRLRASAKIPSTAAGRHQLTFLNTHRTESSVYLVNVLVPSNPGIRITDQRRDRAQLGLTLDYAVTGSGPSPGTWAALAGLATVACLFLRRGTIGSS